MAEFDSQGEAMRRAGAMIAAAIVAGSLVLSWGMSREEQRYQAAAVGDSLVRLDTQSGEMLACNQQGCVRVEAAVREQRIGPIGVVVDRTESKSGLPAPKPQPALPAPAREAEPEGPAASQP